MKIVVLAGGLSPERNVSLSSGVMVAEALRSRGHRVALVDLYFGLENWEGTPEEVYDAPAPEKWRRVDHAAPDLEAVKAAIRPNTKMIYFETPNNPMMKVTDVRAIKDIAGADIRVVVDGTFAPPPVQHVLQLGADIVLHSITKYINGHGDALGGVVIGRADDIRLIRANSVTKINGCPPSPFNSYLVLRGMKTLALRMKQHCASAMEIARYLEANPYVKAVYYPGLESHPQHELASRQMENGMYGGMISFELKDDVKGLSSFEAGKKLLNSLKIPAIAVSLGDPDSLIEHPASMTHANVSPEDRLAAGITDGLIRLSVGLESAKDLIADFEQAFAAI